MIPRTGQPALLARRCGVHRFHAPASLWVAPLTVASRWSGPGSVRCCVLNIHTHTYVKLTLPCTTESAPGPLTAC